MNMMIVRTDSEKRLKLTNRSIFLGALPKLDPAFIVKPTIKFTRCNVARLGNLASEVRFCVL